jgi:hypothetical protein
LSKITEHKFNPQITFTYVDATQAAIQQKQQKASHDNKAVKKVNNFKDLSDLSYQGAHRIMRGDCNYGDEIVIETPACVNVEVCQRLDGKQVTKRRQSQLEVLQILSNHKDKIIIPLVQSKANKKPKK